MSLTQLCRCSHFPAPVVALRAPRDRLTISSWARGFHNLSNTEASTSHGLFSMAILLAPRSSSHFSAQAHWPDRKSSAQLPQLLQCRGCRHLFQVSWNQVGALQKVPRPLGRAKDRVAASARPRSCTDGGEMGGLASEVWTRHHFSHQQRGYDGDVMENVGITMGNIWLS
jgi:hypothetical protein